jgi:hypothetical protein
MTTINLAAELIPNSDEPFLFIVISRFPPEVSAQRLSSPIVPS